MSPGPKHATITHILGKKVYPDAFHNDEMYPLTVHYTTISKKDLFNSLYLSDQPFEMSLHICTLGVIRIDNVLNEDGVCVDATVYDLPKDIILDMASIIIKTSQAPENLNEKLSTNLDVYLDKNLTKDTWKCEVCKQRQLDKVRNCGFLGGADKDKNKFYTDSFVLDVGGVLYTHCPIYDVDAILLNDAMTCYSMYEKGLLPEKGGVYDQTEFFVISSTIVTNKLAEHERKEMEKLKKKTNT